MLDRKIFYNLDDQSKYFIRRGYWFHVDGALGASYMRFIEMAYENGMIKEKPGPIFDFRLDFVCSIVTSTHKWIGAPWPCGVYLTRSSLQLRPPSDISFLEATTPKGYRATGKHGNAGTETGTETGTGTGTGTGTETGKHGNLLSDPASRCPRVRV